MQQSRKSNYIRRRLIQSPTMISLTNPIQTLKKIETLLQPSRSTTSLVVTVKLPTSSLTIHRGSRSKGSVYRSPKIFNHKEYMLKTRDIAKTHMHAIKISTGEAQYQ